jgi:MinD superfamily P-loop ATPase
VKQLAIISGKGGTGKTSVAAGLVTLAATPSCPVVAADCDVDAANLALLLAGDDGEAKPFHAGRRARVDEDGCDGCGACEQFCRFDAIELDGTARIDPLRCEGCGVCELVCPTEAIRFVSNQAGWTMQRNTAAGPLVHARLGVAQDNSGKLVAAVREQARQVATERGIEVVIIDGPPGLGCPVHATLTGCDRALVVTEPTPSGRHDLERALDLVAQFRMKAALLINKHDLAPAEADRIGRLAHRRDVPLLGRIPFDPRVPKALARGHLPLELDSFGGPLASAWGAIQQLWEP